MKKIFCVYVAIFLGFFISKGQSNLQYFLPENAELDDNIPTPEQITGYEMGNWHFSHDQLLLYAREIAKTSERATIFEYARSWENRPLVYLVFTHPENHKNLDQIRQNHIQYSKYGNDPDPSLPLPVIVHLGYGVHGNESSASNSSLLTMYYLASTKEKWVKDFLKDNIIIVDPCLNPDGFNRHSTWINMNRSQTLVSDPAARGFNEPWPGARTNHYWFDLNRDYIPLTHPESQGRIETFHKWLPHILTDHHEMGADYTFFFQPGVETRNNPIVPQQNYILTRTIAEFHAEALNNIGVTYFTEERFDDYYFGKGSSYPDANGGIGILFEQAGFRGHLRETIHGEKTFSFAVRNQFKVSLSTLKAAVAIKDELLKYQQNFFKEAIEKGAGNHVKGYVFGEEYDKNRLANFTRLLLNHQIKIHTLTKDFIIGNRTFKKDYSFLVETSQEQYHLIKSLFDPVNEFQDTTFYDVSTWTLPYSFNIEFSELKSLKDLDAIKGEEITNWKNPETKIEGSGEYAIIMDWSDYNAAPALFEIQINGLRTYVSMEEFNLESNSFDYGSIVIPYGSQPMKKTEIDNLLSTIAEKYGVQFRKVSTGLSDEGISLGSSRIRNLHKPEVALITGNGSHSYTTGEIWHYLDTHVKMPVSLINIDRFNRTNLDRYSVICMAGWSFDDLGDTGKEKLIQWIEDGGTLISVVYPLWWLKREKMLEVNVVDEPKTDHENFDYVDRYKVNDIHRIAGTIFQIEADLSHPLFYGYKNSIIPVFKNSPMVIENTGKPFTHPAKYTDSPLLSGYASDENVERIKNSPYTLIQSRGSGRIIHLMDNPNFRGKWHGTSRIFANAVFFGGVL